MNKKMFFLLPVFIFYLFISTASSQEVKPQNSVNSGDIKETKDNSKVSVQETSPAEKKDSPKSSASSEESSAETPQEKSASMSMASTAYDGPQDMHSLFGLGSKIQVDPSTGSAGTAIPFGVPQGRGGIQPNIELTYNSSAGNSVVGVGWDLELGIIERSTKKGVMA